MKRLTLTLLLACSAFAHAGPIDDIVNECVRQMELGACAAQLDPGNYTPAQLAGDYSLGTLGRVPFTAYLAVRGTGDMRMCAAALDACRASMDSDRCKVARALWGG